MYWCELAKRERVLVYIVEEGGLGFDTLIGEFVFCFCMDFVVLC